MWGRQQGVVSEGRPIHSPEGDRGRRHFWRHGKDYGLIESRGVPDMHRRYNTVAYDFEEEDPSSNLQRERYTWE